MIVETIRLVVGVPLVFFLPGYLIMLIFFDELDLLERIGFGSLLSISLTIALGLFLGYNTSMRDLTGGITAMNLWVHLGSITVALTAIYLVKTRLE